MKLKLGETHESPSASECLNLGRELFKIDCAFAFTKFLSGPERRKLLDLKGVPTSDILVGLITAASSAKTAAGRFSFQKRPELEKRLKSVSSAANRIANKVRKSGLKAYGGKELEELMADVEKSSKKHLDALQKAAEEVCSGPIVAPKKKTERAS